MGRSDVRAALTSDTGFSTGRRQAREESLALYPGVDARSIHVHNFMVAADSPLCYQLQELQIICS